MTDPGAAGAGVVAERRRPARTVVRTARRAVGVLLVVALVAVVGLVLTGRLTWHTLTTSKAEDAAKLEGRRDAFHGWVVAALPADGPPPAMRLDTLLEVLDGVDGLAVQSATASGERGELEVTLTDFAGSDLSPTSGTCLHVEIVAGHGGHVTSTGHPCAKGVRWPANSVLQEPGAPPFAGPEPGRVLVLPPRTTPMP